MSDELTNRPERVERAIRELNAAFIDATVHAQDAFALLKYVQDLEITELEAERMRQLFRNATAALEAANARIAELEAERASLTQPTSSGLTRDALQQKAIDHGLKYWRAPDAHGVTGTIKQAEDLIADLIGVEVEIKGAGADHD